MARKAATESPALTGTHRVRVFRPSWSDMDHWFKTTRAKIEVRSHSLKLRYWPSGNDGSDGGHVLDLDWEWIKSLPGMKVGELRIGDEIGGHKNLRVIFYVGQRDPDSKETDSPRRRMPIIWVLAVLPKKAQAFSKAQIAIFRARRQLVVERYYKQRSFN